MKDLFPRSKIDFAPRNYQFPSDLLEDLTEVDLAEELKTLHFEGFPRPKSTYNDHRVPVLTSENAMGVVIKRTELEKVVSGDKTQLLPKIDVAKNEKDNKKSLPCKPKQWLTIKSSIDKINSVEYVLSFVESESKQRKSDRKSAVTKPLDQKHWKALKLHLKGTCKSGKMKRKELSKLKDKIKLWILYPDLKGEPPQNWNQTLKQLEKRTFQKNEAG